MHGAKPTMHHRLAWTHRDSPEAELHALPCERGLNEIMLADPGATERNQHIGALVAGPPDGRCERLEIVAGDAEVDDARTLRLGHRGEGVVVRGDDLTGTDRRARQHDFIASGE